MASFRGFFHWRVSGVFIFFFCALAFTMLSLSPSVDNPQPLLIMAYIFLVAGLFWSLGYWLTCDFLHKKNTKFWKRRKREKATAWQKKAYYVWKYSVASLIICIFIASAFLSQWIGKQIEIKNTKTGQIFTAILEAVNIIKKTSQQPIVVTPETGKTVTPSEKKPVETAYLRGSLSGFYNKSPFAENRPIKVMVKWNNYGFAPAKNTKPLVKVYLLPDTNSETEDAMIQEFNEEYKQHLPAYDKVENRWIYPNDPNPSIVMAEGEKFTKNIEHDFDNGHIQLYIIAKSRFEDGAGQHEARLCQRLRSFSIIKSIIGKSEITNIGAIWIDCAKHNTPIDIK